MTAAAAMYAHAVYGPVPLLTSEVQKREDKKRFRLKPIPKLSYPPGSKEMTVFMLDSIGVAQMLSPGTRIELLPDPPSEWEVARGEAIQNVVFLGVDVAGIKGSLVPLYVMVPGEKVNVLKAVKRVHVVIPNAPDFTMGGPGRSVPELYEPVHPQDQTKMKSQQSEVQNVN